MGHYAKLDENNIVIQVNVVEEDYFSSNPDRYTGTWVKTSYNTRGGVHYNPETNEPSADQSKALRKNYAGIGYVYDQELDAFYAPQPYPSWTLDEETCFWESPTPYPTDGKLYTWNEETTSWTEVE